MGKRDKRRHQRLERILTDNSLDPQVFEAYGLKLANITPMRRAFRLDTNKGVYGFKKERYALEEMDFIYQAIEHLARQGFDRVSRFKPTAMGQPFYIDQQGAIYFATYWVEGKPSNYERLRDVLSCARAIAEMHEASKGFPLAQGNVRNELGSWPEKFHFRGSQLKEFAQRVSQQDKLTRFERLYLKEWESFYREARMARERVVSSPYRAIVNRAAQERTFCHHDLAYHNILIDNNRAAFIDFEYCLIDTTLHDLANFIMRTMKQNEWNVHLCYQILDHYHRVRPIQQEDLEVMQAFMTFPQDFWQVSFTYFCEDIGRTEAEAIKRLTRAIKTNGVKQHFLDEFAKI